MNWRQLYTSATREERDDLSIFFQRIEAYQNRWVMAAGRLIRNRRHSTRQFHFLKDRRSPIPQWRRALIKTMRHLSITFSIGALTGGLVTFALSVSPHKSVPLILIYEFAIVGLLYLRPFFKRKATILRNKYLSYITKNSPQPFELII